MTEPAYPYRAIAVYADGRRLYWATERFKILNPPPEPTTWGRWEYEPLEHWNYEQNCHQDEATA